MALGVKTGNIGSTVANNFERLQKVVAKAPDWLKKADQFTSIEIGGGYNPTPLPSEKPWYWSVSGQIRIPVADFFGLFASKPASTTFDGATSTNKGFGS
jgi:hypothetical protein